MSKIAQRQIRIRKKIRKVSDRPLLSVYRSNRYCYVQIVAADGDAIVGLSEKVLLGKTKAAPMDRAKQLGVAIAKLALEKKVTKIAFDKGRFAYHGRVKAIAEGAREGGLQF